MVRRSCSKATIPENGDKARVSGIEFSFSKAFTSLPAPFDGLLTDVNYTYTDAEGNIAGRHIPLPTSSKHTFNVVLGYEKGPVSLRVAGTYRSKYLDQTGSVETDAAGNLYTTDRYVDEHFQLDATARLKVMHGIQVILEGINIFNRPFFAYQPGPDGKRLLQYEEYAPTIKFGVKATF